MTDEQQAALDKEKANSPLRIEFSVTLADGTRVSSNSFMTRETWNSLDPKERHNALRESTRDAAKAICDLAEQHGDLPALPVAV